MRYIVDDELTFEDLELAKNIITMMNQLTIISLRKITKLKTHLHLKKLLKQSML